MVAHAATIFIFVNLFSPLRSITLASKKTGTPISEPILDQSKSRRAAKRRRNLVAKNNKNKGGFHRAKKDYRRKEKYPVDFVV